MADKPVIVVPVAPPDFGDVIDFNRCFEYIMINEQSPNMSKEKIAEHFGVSRQTIYDWTRKWKKTGLMDRIQKEYILPVFVAELERSHRNVMARWPDVIARQLATATIGRSDQFALQAAAWLNDTIIVPAEALARREESTDELDYIKQLKEGMALPLSIGDES